MTTPAETPVLEIQKGLYAALTGDTQLVDLLAGDGVYDFVPERAPFPYIHLGEATETPRNAHDNWGRETLVTLHIWSQYRGYAQALTIAVRVMQVLDHQPLTVAGHHHIATRYVQLLTLTDPEPPGDIRHVPISFRVTTEQA